MGQPTTNHKLGPIPTRDFRIAPPPNPNLTKFWSRALESDPRNRAKCRRTKLKYGIWKQTKGGYVHGLFTVFTDDIFLPTLNRRRCCSRIACGRDTMGNPTYCTFLTYKMWPRKYLAHPQFPTQNGQHAAAFQAYLPACATKAGRDMPGPKDIDTAYKAFQRQHPPPRPSEHETPNDGSRTQEEPTPSAEGWTPPTILLLAPNGHKHATRTVQRHHAPWSIPKHNAPETDVPLVRHSD